MDHQGTSYYRAEFEGAHHERKAGARPYQWAQAYQLTTGEVFFPRYSGRREALTESLPRVGSSWTRWVKGSKVTETCSASAVVPVTVRTVKARTPEQVAAAKLGGERRQARNHMEWAANLRTTCWGWSTEKGYGEQGDLVREQQAIDRIIECLHRLDELGIGREAKR